MSPSRELIVSINKRVTDWVGTTITYTSAILRDESMTVENGYSTLMSRIHTANSRWDCFREEMDNESS